MVSEATEEFRLRTWQIFKVKKVEFISFQAINTPYETRQKVNTLKSFLESGMVYFGSDKWNLTNDL